MDMPLRAFWVFNANVSRLQAELDIRLLNVLASSQSSDGYQDHMSSLRQECGTPVVSIDNRRDENATEKLREALLGI